MVALRFARRSFYLYVDEFQNFATDSFAVILSEARKYKLCLVVANQYIAQMEETVRGAVFGNVGTIISFRVSPDDSAFLQKYFEPQFLAADIIQMQNQNFVTTMIINGEKMPAFSGRTLMMPKSQDSHIPEIIENARLHFTRPRAEVEAVIQANSDTTPLQKGQIAAPVAQQPIASTNSHLQPQNPAGSLLGLSGVAPVALDTPQIQTDGADGQKKKRKRTRSRRKKNNSDQQ
jgi:hypothetical protein